VHVVTISTIGPVLVGPTGHPMHRSTIAAALAGPLVHRVHRKCL